MNEFKFILNNKNIENIENLENIENNEIKEAFLKRWAFPTTEVNSSQLTELLSEQFSPSLLGNAPLSRNALLLRNVHGNCQNIQCFI